MKCQLMQKIMLRRTWYACCLKVTILLLKKFKWDLMSWVSRLCEKLATPTTCYASASNTHLIPIISIFIIKPDLTLIKSKHRKCTLKLRNRNVIWKVIAGYPGSFDCRESRVARPWIRPKLIQIFCFQEPPSCWQLWAARFSMEKFCLPSTECNSPTKSFGFTLTRVSNLSLL